MTYLTKEEYEEFEFDKVTEFDKLLKHAEMAINLYIRDFYSYNDFERDYKPRKDAVKHATAFQIAYLDSSGILTAEDRQSIASMTVGRTSVSFQNSSQNVSQGRSLTERYNLSLDAENWLKSVGFGYLGVGYDR